MKPNPRIHRPSARSYIAGQSSVPTITQSTALWKAMRHREEMEQREAAEEAGRGSGGFWTRLRHAVAGLGKRG